MSDTPTKATVLIAGGQSSPGQNHLEHMWLPALDGAGLVASAVWVPLTATEESARVAEAAAAKFALPFSRSAVPPTGSDAILVCASGQELVDIVNWAADQELPVFVDKPTMSSTEDLSKIELLAPTVRIFPGHHTRWIENIHEAIRRVRTGQIGLLRTIAIDHVVSAGDGFPPKGDLRNLGVYQVDIIEALLGSLPETVQGYMSEGLGGPGQSWNYIAQGDHDVVVSGHISRMAETLGVSKGILASLRVQGTHGSFSVDLAGQTATVSTVQGTNSVAFGASSVAILMAQFGAMVRSGSDPYGLRRVLSISRFLDAIAESAQTGDPATVITSNDNSHFAR